MVFLIGVLSLVSIGLFIAGILSAVFAFGAVGSSKPGVGLAMLVLAIVLVTISL